MSERFRSRRRGLWMCAAAALAAAATPILAADPAAGKKPEAGAGHNVQVLTGMTDQQLQRSMQLMRGSLGVGCDFCHVMDQAKGWDFASDEKDNKKTARSMIRMVMELNKSSFEGQPRISCFTCHQGRVEPNNLLALPQTPPPPRAAEPARGPADMPAPGQILDRYIEALGGAAAVDRLTSRVVKGTVVTWDNKELPFELAQQAPNKYFSQMTSPMGANLRVFDGAAGWVKGPRGVREIPAADLPDAARSADLFAEIKLKEKYPSFRPRGKEAVNGKDAWVLQASAGDDKVERFFFDAQSGLLVRHVTLTRSPIGMIPEQVDFDDYRDVDGVKEPFKVTLSLADPWSSQTRRYAEVKHNVPIDPGRFARPEAPPPAAPPSKP